VFATETDGNLGDIGMVFATETDGNLGDRHGVCH
jgi:hypothetical protein